MAEELSEEDQNLKNELEMLVERLKVRHFFVLIVRERADESARS